MAMIFGFNTEVVLGQTCYHLQSEFRARDRVLQTQVFVSGQCVGKVATQPAAELPEADCQQSLREQHRAAVAATRDGKIEQWLAAGPAPKVTSRK
jgi:hypothetical protein